eukprot:584630-Prymnesium_polylepis.1
MSTRNRIVRGEEVPFAAEGIANPHFRQLATEATANMSNGTNMSRGSIAPTGASPSGAGGGGSACSDVPGTFTSIALCTGGAECAQGMAAGVALYGGWAATCGMSAKEFGQQATAAGCPIAFAPPASNDAPMSQLCPAACVDAGIEVQGCAVVPAAPPTPPLPPASPPMPPLVPGPSGFITVGTVTQLRAAIDAAPSGSALALFLPPGQVFYLKGSPIA